MRMKPASTMRSGACVGDAREEIRIEARAIGIAARIERERRDAGFFGAPERLRVRLVARDQHDLDRHAPRSRCGFDQRLEIGAAARRENGDAQSRCRQRSESKSDRSASSWHSARHTIAARRHDSRRSRPHRVPSVSERRDRRRARRCRDDQRVADAAVERAEHLVARDVAFAAAASRTPAAASSSRCRARCRDAPARRG